MAGYRVISSDSHIVEPPDLWTSRVESKYRDHAPRIVRMEDGTDRWFCGDINMVGMHPGIQPGTRFEEPEKLTMSGTFDEVRIGGYVPEEHVKDLDVDGVDSTVLYPSCTFSLFSFIQDSDLLTALFRAYNDWVADFCKPYPDRLKGIALINVDNVEIAVKEMERCARLGLVGATVTVYPPTGRAYDSPEYEPLWAAAQDLQMPLSLHIGSNRPGPGESSPIKGSRSDFTNIDHWVRMSLADMIFGGVFRRYPKLQVGSVEMELAWAPHFLGRMDYDYTQRPLRPGWTHFDDDMLPSDYFHRNVFVAFQEDSLGIRLRDIIGVDNLLWGADYPHQEGTFPRSRQILEEILVDCTEEEKAKIAGGNTARLYHLDEVSMAPHGEVGKPRPGNRRQAGPALA